MACSAGPDIIESGLVLALDAADYKSFKGSAATNLLYSITNAYGEINGTYFKTSYGDEQVFIPMLGYKTVRYCNIYNNYPNSGECCPSPLRYGGSVLGQNIAVSSSTTYTYQIIYKTTSGYTHPNFMYRYEYGASGYVTEGGVHSDSNRTSLGDGWYHAWGQFTTQSTTTYLWLTGMWYYQYGVYDKISIAGVSLHQGTFIISPEHILLPQENRGTTVATGGGWADLSGNGNHGELVNGVRESSDNLGALVFDGVDDYVAVPRQSLLNLGTQLTICGFVQINRLDLDQPIFSTFDVQSGVYTEGYKLSFRYNSQYGMDEKTLQFQFGQSSWRWNVYASNGISITDNNYHFVSVTAVNLNTSSPIINFYIDENKVNATYWTGASTGPIRYSSTTQSIRIGSAYPASLPSYGTDYSEITTGQLSIYNRALTPQEIQQNFNMMRGRFGI